MEDAETNLKIIRFTAFLFFMAELLPLPFMPLFIADLYSHSPLVVFQFSSDAVKGLPFSAHLLGVMIFLPVVGYLAQKVSLKILFLICGGFLLAGNLLASLSNSLEVLMLFRLLSGMGYGGVLAASAGLVVQTTDKKHRTTGFASWGAGFAAASICAVALGGILVSHVGYRNGLIVSAILSLVLATFILFYLPNKAPGKTVAVPLGKWSDIWAPFRHRSTFAALVFASIPAQLAFFGLFQYTLPLAMNQIGITDANIGRILTIYGLISLAAPLLARFADRTRKERLLIIAGNLLTGVVLAAFFLETGVWTMIIGVAAIGLGGLMFDTVISSYLTMTKVSEELGETKFLSIFSTWEKLFTVFVPVVVGMLMSQFGYLPSAGIMGVFIAVGAILFTLFSRPAKSGTP
jgi:predicted MFS family arabinose efflux permease